MKDYWRWRGRSHILVRVWWPARWGRSLECWALAIVLSLYQVFIEHFSGTRWRRSEVSLKTSPKDNGYCHCRVGSTTTLRLMFGEFGLWVGVGRYQGPIPCDCDRAYHDHFHIPEGLLDCGCPASPFWTGEIDVRRELETAGVL
jgi:hypothetical protein